MSLEDVMIYAKPARVLANACWSCGKSDTYCDGRIDRELEMCCTDCATSLHDAHSGLH